ncbi:hypothetical protein HOU35_gp094 [Acinetobacter phage vB_AbaM_B09_Aci05]|uniref:Uncharacterized protein n=1 Tax=Acinetobacter phage vB_AbaM_B09_Aci05 TaxID=2315458 RepID=A0A386KAD5_9CAUD|nr:hypothetical protein HOU35_gp094 [Acinetobacter phage vB_AbaM_B09_Aci05]AYD82348.1 hypothetical protein Aci05_083 [Acinetobacter phage vB_AbaM_B09_Aci05]
MSILGKSFKVVNNCKMKDLGIKVGEILKVVETCEGSNNEGALAVEVIRNGKVETLKVNLFSEYWCFFSEGMIEKGQLIEVEPTVGDETEYLMKGKNGERLNESVKNIRSKSYLHAYGVESLEDRYNNWIVENIHVYELFCEFAIKAIQSGKKKISHWLIVNRLRWEVEIETKGTCYQDKDFKISNDYIAFLARDFMKDYPQYGEVFTIKQMKRV